MKSKLALFGLGYWGSKIKSTLNQMGYLIEVVDANRRLSTATIDKVIGDSSVSHCFIATPEETHFQLAKKLLAAGKHVFVEKPLCLTVQEAKDLINLAKKNQVNLFVDCTFLYDPAVQLIDRLIKKNVIGSLYRIESIRHSINIHKTKINVFDDLAPHDIYLAQHFFKSQLYEVEVVRNTSQQLSTGGSVKYELREDRFFVGYYSWDHPTQQRDMTFFGSEGAIQWLKESHGDKIVVFKFDKNHDLIKKSERIVAQKTSPLQLAIEDFLKKSKLEKSAQRQKRYSQYIADIGVLESIRAQNSPR